MALGPLALDGRIWVSTLYGNRVRFASLYNSFAHLTLQFTLLR